VEPVLVCEKIMGSPREGPAVVLAFGRDWAERKQGRRGGAVSRRHSSRVKRAGSSRRRVTRPTKSPEASPRRRPERCPYRMVRVNEKGKSPERLVEEKHLLGEPFTASRRQKPGRSILRSGLPRISRIATYGPV